MQTFEWLNAFFTQMSQAITDHHGFVDKFLGDAIFAVFDRVENHAEDGLNAAVTMLQKLSEFNRDRQKFNLEQPVKVGIGIHTGFGLIGTVGSDNRMDSTVIGDVVNTAARLEELTKLYDCPILASGVTLAHVKANLKKASLDAQSNSEITPNPPLSYYSRWVDCVTPRGKQQVLNLYEILGTSSQILDKAKLRSQSTYDSGIEALHQKDYARASEYFQQVVEQNPTDAIARLCMERCQTRLGLTPQQTKAPWNGFIAG
jgi:two-component system sensor histidine kinase ChiS